VKVYAGEGGPMKLDTPGIEIVEIGFDNGDHKIVADLEKIHSVYLLNGTASIEGEALDKGDFVILSDKAEIQLSTNNEATIFKISSPVNVNYATYGQI
jgi:redox-sensitive bicupin YhaK (pirin superfamily)